MKPTAHDGMTAGVFATNPCRGLSLSRYGSEQMEVKTLLTGTQDAFTLSRDPLIKF
jgi:hypothetical protein